MASLPLVYTTYGFAEFMPQPEQQQFSSSVADLKRDEEISKLKELVSKLSAEVNRLGDMISDIGVVVSRSHSISDDIVVLRTITRAQAKQEIMGLLDGSDKLYYHDIATTLRLDLEEVVSIVTELESEGLVGEAN
ncbi:MAG: hypothetical protein NTV25_02730 [Methanothrix sp.]|nr:hypothetical protein [Methanothrix sp.]